MVIFAWERGGVHDFRYAMQHVGVKYTVIRSCIFCIYCKFITIRMGEIYMFIELLCNWHKKNPHFYNTIKGGNWSAEYDWIPFQMDARNLGIVFGPTLMRTNEADMTSMVRDMAHQCRVIETIILHVSHSQRIHFSCCMDWLKH
jgi:hypothetical protein